jgi:hypothetical protein
MQVRDPEVWYIRSELPNVIVFFTGLAVLLVGLSFDWTHLLTTVRFPAGELSNPWVRADLAMLRGVCVLIATALILSRIVLWRCPQVVAGVSYKMEVFISIAAKLSLFIPLSLTTLVLMKTVLQLSLYLIGYTVYAADDFTRSLSAAYWLYYRKFDLGMDGWVNLGLAGSGWLPFSDYLFGLGLALNPDLFLTPKIVNLAISAIAVIVVYLLGRELFGRAAGFLTACLFAFQPWHVWLGISGMTSDLPSVMLIGLFGLFLARWLRTDEPRALLAAAGSLGIANGFRYENWFFSLVASLLILFIAVLRWRRGRLVRQWVIVAVCALTIINAFPIIWMTASYIRLGDWLPTLHTNVNNYYTIAFTDSSTTSRAMINMPVFAIGSFPFELAFSFAGVVLFLRSDRYKLFHLFYLVVPLAAFLVFGLVVKWRLPAYLMCARYFLPFVILLLPYGGFLLAELQRARHPWRNEGLLAVCLILLAIGALDIGRAFNYPAMFPKDGIYAGWTIRGLQNTGTVPENGKILIERAEDWGDLAVVALANRPERFVVLHELGYRPAALPVLSANDAAPVALIRNENVRRNVCEAGFQTEACKTSLLQENFNLVILSSPNRVSSFQETFHASSWNIGRYHIFDMKSLPASRYSALLRSGTDKISSR